MRRRFSDRHALQTLSELNVTPLLDLAFVLLIIFMITTPLMENSTDLVLPGSDAAATPVDMDKVQSVSIRADGQLMWNETIVSITEVEHEAAKQRASNPELAVLIRPHHEQSIQRLSEVLDALRRAGIKRIGLASTPKE